LCVISALFDTGTVKVICELGLLVRLNGDLVPVVRFEMGRVFHCGFKSGCYRLCIPSYMGFIWIFLEMLAFFVAV
jgi:hypothetical protein